MADFDYSAYEAHLQKLNDELHTLAALLGNIGTEIEHLATTYDAAEVVGLRALADRINALAQSANKLSVTAVPLTKPA